MSALEQAFVRLGARIAGLLLNLPTRVVKLLAGPVPPAARGLHPEALLLGRLSSLPRPGGGSGIGGNPAARERMDIEAEVFAARAPRSVASEDSSIPGPAGEIPIRIYTPIGFAEPGPLLVFFHGGGWVSGSLTSHDGVCRTLADTAGVRVVAVDYRLAPEHPYPAAADDAIAAWDFIATNPQRFGADPARIAVGGDSAGGNLSAVVSNNARSEEHPAPAFQLLIYPVVDLRMHQESYKQFAKGFYLTLESINAFADQYAPDESTRHNPRVAPLLAGDLTGAPPAYVATALADPLRDEGEQYAEMLAAAGVPVKHERFLHIHGFMNMTESSAARLAARDVALALRDGLARAAKPTPSNL